jgi:hypothetical protein
MTKPSTASLIIHFGWCAGLSYRLAGVLMGEGYQSRDEARAAVMDGRLSPETVIGLDPIRYEMLCKWLGIEPQSGKPTKEEVAAAVALLERAGYEVRLMQRISDVAA